MKTHLLRATNRMSAAGAPTSVGAYADLKKRIAGIMTKRKTNKMSFGRMLLLAAFGIAVIARPVVSGLASGPQIRGIATQAAQPTGTPLPSFEVASIKQNRSGNGGCIFAAARSPGRFVQTNCSIKMLIEYAYMQGQPQPWVRPFLFLKDDQLVGGPGWISTDKYDIEARMPDSEAEKYQNRSWEERTGPTRLMVQTMLAERFKLRVRRETRDGPVYALVVAKGGPKFSPANVATTDRLRAHNAEVMRNPSAPAKGIAPCAAGTGCMHSLIGMSALAEMLSRFPEVGRPVSDQTGLKGVYYVDFYWARVQASNGMMMGPQNDDAAVGNAPAFEPSGPSIFSALREQLGLKLEATKGPVEFIVIDYIERPSEN